MSGLGIFRRNFTIRRFGKEEIVDGYGHTSYEDSTVSLNVQPLSADEIQALPEGERRTKRLKAYGDFTFTTADQSTGRPVALSTNFSSMSIFPDESGFTNGVEYVFPVVICI